MEQSIPLTGDGLNLKGTPQSGVVYVTEDASYPQWARQGIGADPSPKASLFRKLAEAMGEMQHVAERGKNPTFGYAYATAGDLIMEVRDKLASRGVALVPSVVSVERVPLAQGTGEVRTTRGGNAITLTRVRMSFLFLDGETGATLERFFEGEGADEADKGLNKAYTAALKYFLRQAFLIPIGDDAEADGRHDTQPAQRKGPASDKPSNAQLGKIRGLMDEINDPGKVRPVFAPYGVERVSDLSKRQASEFIEKLTALKDAPPVSDIPSDFEEPPKQEARCVICGEPITDDEEWTMNAAGEPEHATCGAPE